MTTTSSISKGADAFDISAVSLSDMSDFIHLQDGFVDEHAALTGKIYDSVQVRDWQLSLVVPDHIMKEIGGRERHTKAMILRSDAIFKGLYILKATLRSPGPKLRWKKSEMVGFIMYQVHEKERVLPKKKSQSQKRSRSSNARCEPFTEVVQLFVDPRHRRKGCGALLMDAMVQTISPEHRGDLRLSCLDLNVDAIRWYTQQAFQLTNLTQQYLGDRADANIIVYQGLQRWARQAPLPTPLLVKTEVLGEELTLTYPQNHGGETFHLRIVEYLKEERWHKVNSEGLDLWDGEAFEDTIDLNLYLHTGSAEFHRPLSLIFRDAELARREERRQKKLRAEVIGLNAELRELSPPREVARRALAATGRCTSSHGGPARTSQMRSVLARPAASQPAAGIAMTP